MEVDALVLVIVVVSVALTTFVFTILGKYCFEKFVSVDNHSTLRRSQRRRSRTTRRHACHCHPCPVQAFNQASYVGVGIGNKTNAINQKNQVAVNIGQASEEDLKLHTFAQLAPPAAAGASENPSSFAPSETFARLGIRSSKDGKAFDLDRQLQIAHASSSEINLHAPNVGVPVPGIGQYLRQISLAQQDSSYLHYEDIISGTRDATGNPTNPFPEVPGLSGTVRDPGDGQQKDDEDLARNNLRDLAPSANHDSNQEKTPKPVTDQVKAGSSGLHPFKGAKLTKISMQSLNPDHDNEKPLSIISEASSSSIETISTHTVKAAPEIKKPEETFTKSKESIYEKPIEVYDLKSVTVIGEEKSSNGTVDPANHEYGEGDGDVFTYSHLGISHGDLKRFSYPRPSNHCPTCSCQHRVITDALLLSREKKRVSEELFEQESAKKNMALTDSAFHIQTKAAGPNQMGKRKTIVLFNNKDDQEL